MSPRTALATTVTGTLLTLAPISPAAVRNARRTIDPTAPYEQDPDVTADITLVARLTRSLRVHYNEGHLLDLGAAEDRLLAAHGHHVATREQRYQARQAMRAAANAVYAAADRAHPPADCPRCRAWDDCPDADRTLRDAIHADWVDRWTAPLHLAA